ncbi:Eco57I restriction-modification methylase domain-containing protein [Stratiformator vulcanicus]|uniref:site-specific DNA-methyltransferase (adenine-specific) n=1 Tax=Stratiformator vulcanicus TaxID=2527980 RepID=A0A517QYR2_9PLAN|nr:DNA methyltransferase [Stratiformator vulcanicus]QDT36738.1 Type IIS restriction enzyme Eco57I [Stratiformator vulcanicus]
MPKKKKSPPKKLFSEKNPVADRQPKTDRLILPKLLSDAVHFANFRKDETTIELAHKTILKWADLEASGKLAKLKETQMQGDFLAEVFGDVLGYAGPTDGAEIWQRIQHHTISGQTPDAVFGSFRPEMPVNPVGVVELKGPTVHLDRDRSNGRTAVDQCWDYLVNTPPECRWGIVSNIVSFRLYERNSTKRVYEHYTLQSLRDLRNFKSFYATFNRQGLVDAWTGGRPRTVDLLEKSQTRQREVSDELYETYSRYRTDLISHLHVKEGHELDLAIEMAQRLFDRVIFIAFCEDRHLLPQGTIPNALKVAGFQAVTNPKWQNFKNLFRFIDQGSQAYDIPRYNGGLFAAHQVDSLDLPDNPWTTFFKAVSGYDFAAEVNLDVLGHLFERSITELEKLKESGLFGGDLEKVQKFAQMPQSAKRKRLGIYYTPAELTSRIVKYTVDELIDERFVAAAVEFGIAEDEAKSGIYPDDADFWRQCLRILRDLKVVDPACGSGAFLFQAYNSLEQRYSEVIGQLERAGDKQAAKQFDEIPRYILQDNLYGVDLSPEAVEITQLALWIRSATPGQTLATLSKNIVHGNSLVHDPEVHPAAFDWKERFPEVFDREEAGFDCVIGNPPWERMDLSEREFFALSAPEIATTTTGAKRKELVSSLEEENPALFRQYLETKRLVDAQRTYCRSSNQYPLTGKGRTNCYSVFSELATSIVSIRGRAGLLVPSGIATEKTTKDFFAKLVKESRLIRLYDFENKKVFFPDVHASFKFCILVFSGGKTRNREADFVFFIQKVDEIADRNRHVALTGKDISMLNPNTSTCPIFRTRRDAEVTKYIYRRTPVFIDKTRKGSTGNQWSAYFRQGLFNQTTDSELFVEPIELKKNGFVLRSHDWVKRKDRFVPLYEAKMFRPYDHRFGTIFMEKSNWINQGQTYETSYADHQNPEFLVRPRWCINSKNVSLADIPALLAFRDITRSTDTRTFIASFIPAVGVVNTAPLLFIDGFSCIRLTCLLANLNSIPLDFVAKQKAGHIHMNFFIVEQLPILPPDTYDKPCPWNTSFTLEEWISERVLKLSCTAEDMLPLADACGFTSGSFQKEYGGRLNKWDDAERAELMADLDAAYFHLYGIDRDDAEYILSTFKGIHTPIQFPTMRISVAERILQKHAEMAFPE